MSTSQNGYPVLTSRTTGALPRLRRWEIPGTHRALTLRDGSAGFLLVHFALWFHETIERLDVGVWDEWGWANRPIRGSSVTSNHASGTAMDLDASRHPLAKGGTFKRLQVVRIHARLLFFRGCIRWGGDYGHRLDAMHFELNRPLPAVERLAKKLATSPRGRRILAANPGARAAIYSK